MKAKRIIITEPGEYKTRDGRRVSIYEIRDNGATFPCKGSVWKMFRGAMRPRGFQIWQRNGLLRATLESPLDIVGKWAEFQPKSAPSSYK